ncbi:MAG: 50S ribosomal protein L5 [Deltaproteobacteria bacterium]|jgi:large subunit ribosomal protein L5|nr:50S ribosomal protein L5 [Deltaproteobacteria bacterium]
MPRLKDFYLSTVVSKLIKEFNYKNINQVPKVSKITLNIGLGKAVTTPNSPPSDKTLEAAVSELTAISGQKAVVTKARRSIAAFKLREGMSIGVMVTLRRDKMFYFLDKLVNIVLPRVRDFRGVSPKAFDGRGNYTLGLKEQIIFPEIDYDKIDKVKGLNVTIVTTARTDDEARFLLSELGMPFRKAGQQN